VAEERRLKTCGYEAINGDYGAMPIFALPPARHHLSGNLSADARWREYLGSLRFT